MVASTENKKREKIDFFLAKQVNKPWQYQRKRRDVLKHALVVQHTTRSRHRQRAGVQIVVLPSCPTEFVGAVEVTEAANFFVL
jgi:hypothetical protein